MKSWNSLEHQVWKNLKEFGLDSCDKFILAVSGGLDSMVLLEIFSKVKPAAEIKVACYHHGGVNSFREDSLQTVLNKVQLLNRENIKFYTETSAVVLLTEDEMRTERWKFLRSLNTENDAIIVTAHHLDDRLETMLLKLIRGTSADGLVSFQMWNYDIFRPLLHNTKVELETYARGGRLNWVEDPSNQETSYFRNWVREKWLKDLDIRQPGASRNLAKSLLKIVENLNNSDKFEVLWDSDAESEVMSRQWYVSLSASDQLRGLALFLKKHQITNFTSGQLQEIRKRLDKNQKDITFEMLGRKWVINASQIMLQ